MNSLKKNLPVVVAFLLGGIITYLAVSLNKARNDADALREEIKQMPVPVEAVEKTKDAPETGHWMDELIDKQTAETEQRIKDQQAEGDDFKKQFDQFAE